MKVFVAGYNINYIEEGRGPLVVLLHGWGANLHSFTALFNLLKEKYRVIALDLPGFGESDKLNKSLSVDDYADIIAHFISLKTECSEYVILVGHSYGGRIIIKLNSKDNLPFKILKNVLIDAAGIKDKKDITIKAKILCFKFIKSLVSVLPLSVKEKNDLISKYRNKFGSNDYSRASDALKETLVRSVNEDLTKHLKNMNETLIIWGKHDTVTPVWMANVMKEEIKNSGLVFLNGGHFSYIDDQFTFLTVIKSYFNI